MTAVEWLVEKLQESGIPLMKDELEIVKQANEMFEQQIKNAVLFGDARGKITIYQTAKDYFNENYKK
jgi:hypothetical protein